MKKIFCCIVLLNILTHAHAEYDLAVQLQAAFQNTCPSQGELTITTIQHAEAIKNLIRTIQKDNECYNWAASVGQVSAAYSTITTPSGAFRVDQLENYIDNLSLASSATTDPTIQMTLASEIANSQAQLFALGKNQDKRVWNARRSGIQTLNSYISDLNTTISSNPRCAAINPGLVFHSTGQALAASGNLNLVGSMIGVGLQSIGSIYDIAVTLIQGTKFNKALKNLRDDTLTPALMCAIESISNSYCDAGRTIELIDDYFEQDITIQNPRWRGLLLLKNLFIYNQWINQVVAGSPATNSAISNQKVSAEALRFTLISNTDRINGILGDAVEEINNSSNDLQKRNIRAKFIQDTLGIIGYSGSPGSSHTGSGFVNSKPNPFVNFFPEISCGPTYFFYFGSPIAQAPYNNPQSCKSLLRSLDPPTMQNLRLYIDRMIMAAGQYVALQLSLKKETDALLVLQAAEEDAPQNLFSPIIFIKKTSLYLDNIIKKYSNNLPPKTGYLITETKTKIQKAIEVFNRPFKTPKEFLQQNEATAKLKEIEELLAADLKDSFLSDRLRTIVDFEIDQLLNCDPDLQKDCLPPGQILNEVLTLSLNDRVDTLEFYFNLNLDQKYDDAATAQYLAKQNLSAIEDVFKRKMKQIFSKLINRIKQDPLDKAANRTLDKLCSFSLSLPDLNELDKYSKVHSSCKGRKLISRYNQKINIDYDSLRKSKSFEKRACAHYKYSIANDIYRLIPKN